MTRDPEVVLAPSASSRRVQGGEPSLPLVQEFGIMVQSPRIAAARKFAESFLHGVGPDIPTAAGYRVP